MIVPFILLVLLTTLVPAFGVLNRIWTTGATSAMLAVALMVTAVVLSVSDLARLIRLLRPIIVLMLAIPALWMLAQALPMPWHALANPIWASASAALNQQLVGAITVDIGTTLLSLAQYCLATAVVLMTTVIALDRNRAGHLLWILMAVTTLVAADHMLLELFSPLHGSAENQPHATVVAVVGVLASCTAAIQAVERMQRGGKSRKSRTGATLALSFASVSLCVCTMATLLHANPAVFVAAAGGAGVVIAIFVIRRWLLGAWGMAGLAAVAAIGALGIFATIPINNRAAVAFSTQKEAATERMLSDLSPIGSGAGTFNALLPIYQDFGTANSRESPTAAAAIEIEMGRVFLYALVVATLLAASVLFRRAMSRRQDYIYSAAGSGLLLSLLILAFANGGILNLDAILVSAILLGLAFAQSMSRTAKAPESLPLLESPDAPQAPVSSSLPVFDKMAPRLALAFFGLLLVNQAVWILFAQGYSREGLWTSLRPSTFSPIAQRDEMKKAASIAMVRGDLWAELGFALLGPRWADPAKTPDDENVSRSAYEVFSRALRYAPHRGDVWLALAALSGQRKVTESGTAALLKMSYYTAPNELALLPNRLRVAFGDKASMTDPELRDLIKRDVGIVLSRQPSLKPALVLAYSSVPRDRRLFADRLISEVDPNYLKTIQAHNP